MIKEFIDACPSNVWISFPISADWQRVKYANGLNYCYYDDNKSYYSKYQLADGSIHINRWGYFNCMKDSTDFMAIITQMLARGAVFSDVQKKIDQYHRGNAPFCAGSQEYISIVLPSGYKSPLVIFRDGTIFENPYGTNEPTYGSILSWKKDKFYKFCIEQLTNMEKKAHSPA